MAKIGTLSIDLVANTGKMIGPLKNGEKAIAGLGSAVAGAQSGMLAALGSLSALTAGVISTAVAWSKLTTAMGQIDEIAKVSDRVGATTEELIGLQHAAELSGIGAEGLNAALEMMTKRGRNVDQLDAIADKMRDMVDPVERAKFAVAVFGKSGIGMVNMLKDGSDGLDAVRKDAEELGLTFSRFEAGKVELANDAFTRLGALFDGLFRKMAIELAPFVKVLTDRFVALGTESTSWAGLANAGMASVVNAIALLLDGVDFLRDAFLGAQLGMQQAVSGMATGLAWLLRQVESVAEAIADAFRFAFGVAQWLVTNAVSEMIGEFAMIATWLDSQLPDSLRTGIGAMATEFATAFEDIARENERAFSERSFATDLDFSSTATEFADSLAAGVRESAMEYERFTKRDPLSEKLRSGIRGLRAEVDKAAAELVPDDFPAVFELEKPGAAALERGSNEAFSAFVQNLAAQKTTEEKLVESGKKSADALVKIERHVRGGVVLSPAPGI